MKHQKTKSYKIITIRQGSKETFQDEVAEEKSLSIYLNDQKITTLMCTPQEQKYLGIGFLFSEGLVKGVEEIKKVVFHSKKDQLRILTKKKRRIPKTLLQDQTFTSGCGKGKSLQRYEDLNLLEDVLVNLEFTMNSNIITKLMREFELRSSVFRFTGGTHSAALANKEKILLFKEDIGRHNAVDKVIGESIIKKIPLQNKLLVLSGRVSSDILLKTWRAKINLIVSRSAPTSLAVELAQRLGITVIGFARGTRMNIYSFPMRIAV